MIPGLFSKTSEETVASANVILVGADLIRITGNSQINTINVKGAVGRGGHIIFVTPVDGTVELGTTGNILLGHNPMLQNRLYTLVYSSVVGKWYVSN